LPEPSGDILIFQTEAQGTRFAVRPSGTEPKIKLYLFARSDTSGVSDRSALAEIKAKTARQLDAIANDIEQFIKETLAAP
jgi:phosphoglucomutase/phosphomannomutase